jgi:predicted dithiol-disulfide oxidoreductase (DUF899 family)
MSLPDVVSRAEWLEARKKLLAQEKALTRQHDALNADRRRLPMVRVEKEYVFEGPAGKVTLADLFEDKRQVVIQHVMFGPDWDAPCPSCSMAISQMTPALFAGLRNRETVFVLASRAPYSKIDSAKRERGWDVPWYSTDGSDFNYDFDVSYDASRGEALYNYRGEPSLLEPGSRSHELPGASCFLRDGDSVYYTYSAYARGMEYTGNAYTYLDMTALGRQESWEEPKGRSGADRDGDPSLAS